MRSSPGTSPSHPRVLHLFSGPYVTYGRRRVNVPEGSKRLLVFVALHRGRRYDLKLWTGTLHESATYPPA